MFDLTLSKFLSLIFFLSCCLKLYSYSRAYISVQLFCHHVLVSLSHLSSSVSAAFSSFQTTPTFLLHITPVLQLLKQLSFPLSFTYNHSLSILTNHFVWKATSFSFLNETYQAPFHYLSSVIPTDTIPSRFELPYSASNVSFNLLPALLNTSRNLSKAFCSPNLFPFQSISLIISIFTYGILPTNKKSPCLT